MIRTGGAPVFLAVGNDRQFRLLCDYIGQPALADDARFATAGQRSVHRAVLKPLLEQACGARDGQELADALMAIGVPAAPVLNVEQALAHPHTLHREMVVNMDGYQGLGAPVKLGRTPATYRFAPLSEGQDFLLPPQDVRPR